MLATGHLYKSRWEPKTYLSHSIDNYYACSYGI